jgi:penicillin amidase
VWDRLAALDHADIDDMLSVHNDRISIPARAFLGRLARLDLSGRAGVLRDRLVAWDGDISAGSTEASGYAAARRALARLATAQSGLDGTAGAATARVPPGISPVAMVWWMLADLLRRDDTRLLRGADWDTLLRAALIEAAEQPETPWATAHTPKLVHPLSARFPEAGLDPCSHPIGGDNDTVFATGYAPQLGVRTAYASLCRYVFDVGAWERCRWIVFHGASGQPGSRFYENQNEIWARGETVPMLYDWTVIAAEASARQMLRDG